MKPNPKPRRTSLQNKLILSYLAVALITVLVVSLVVFFSSGRSLMNLVVDQQTAELKLAVQIYYAANNNLDGFSDYYSKLTGLTQVINPAVGPAASSDQQIRGLLGLVDAQDRAVIPTLGYGVGEQVPPEKLNRTDPVKFNGQVIAWILPDPAHRFQLSPEERSFLNHSTTAIALAALAGVFAAVIMGFFLSGRLVLPIRRLTQASQSLAGGDLQQKLPVTSHDELGQLTHTFNEMSEKLALANQQRKRITADITHDLSTPIQIISGYKEMMENKDVSLTPQRVDIIKTELEHLRRLVNDLTTLTQIEADGLEMHLEPVHPSALCERIYQIYQPMAEQQKVGLVLDLPASPRCILVDEGRILQVLKNLVDNALRYTPSGGQITLTASFGAQVQLRVTDSGCGIASEDIPFIFDRFYQADKARTASAGKMGLGLAICKALVTAQGGTITAESAGKDKGTTISIAFPPIPE